MNHGDDRGEGVGSSKPAICSYIHELGEVERDCWYARVSIASPSSSGCAQVFKLCKGTVSVTTSGILAKHVTYSTQTYSTQTYCVQSRQHVLSYPSRVYIGSECHGCQ